MLKYNKAITLIALIITIIVLLILAGVTINMALGENGLFNKAKTSVAKYENAQKKENDVLAGYEVEIDNARDTITISRDDLIELINTSIKGLKTEKSIINKEDGVYSLTNNGYIFNTPSPQASITTNNTIELTQSIEDFKYITFEYDTYYSNSNSYENWQKRDISVDVIKNAYTSSFGWNSGKLFTITCDWGDNRNRISISFIDDKHIYVWFGYSSTTSMSILRITDIKGIK